MFRSAYLQEQSLRMGSRLNLKVAIPTVWFLMNFVNILRAITYMQANEQPISYGAMLFALAGQTVYWTVISWALLWVLDRWPEERRVSFFLIVVVLLIAGSVLLILVNSLLFSMAGFSPKGPFDLFLDLLPRDFHGNMTLIVTVFAAGIALRDRYAAERRRLRALTLETQLLQSQLQRVSAQFQPHFLFNTLHAITATLHKDLDVAEKMLVALGDLLRLSLSFSREEFGTLDDELYFIERYLFLQHVRFGNRLRVDVDASSEARQRILPRFILQPLVENAVMHGIAVAEKGGEIGLRARVASERLEIAIRNSLPAQARWNADGVGLSCVKQRLALLYAQSQHLRFDRSDDSVTVTISLPAALTALPPAPRADRGMWDSGAGAFRPEEPRCAPGQTWGAVP